MKYLIIPYIALGLVLSLVIGVEYKCTGPEMFPTHYGSPFVFRKTNLGSSMEYYFSVSGLILNTLIWSVLLYLVDSSVRKLKKKKVFKIGYTFIIVLLFAFSTLNVFAEIVMLGKGFNKHSNYWYWNMEKEAKDWGVECTGDFKVFGK